MAPFVSLLAHTSIVLNHRAFPQVWQFIIDREIEAPDRFQAIQTFRATKAILQQQKAYVEQLHACGLLDESQNESLLHDIMDKFYLLQKHSMNWKPRGLFEFVSTIPIFAHASKVGILSIRHAMVSLFTALIPMNVMLHEQFKPMVMLFPASLFMQTYCTTYTIIMCY